MKIQTILSALLSILILSTGISIAAEPTFPLEAMMQPKIINEVAISPGGKMVAYTVTQHTKTNSGWRDDTQIFVYDRDTKQSNRYTFSNEQNRKPRWSPNGKWLAYLSTINGKSNLSIVDAKGGTAWSVIQSDTEILEFKWSPASNMLAFVKYNPDTTNPLKPINAARQYTCSNLWLLQLDQNAHAAKQPIQLTHYSQDKICDTVSNGNWSPDQKFLVFSHLPAAQQAVWDYGKISVINLQSGEITHLAQNKMKHRTLEKIVQHSPIYSPDNQMLAFTNDSRVFIYSLDKKTLRELPPTYDELPLQLLGWSPDSKAVYITELYHTFTHILRLPINGQASTAIGPSNKYIQNPSLSADGEWLGFAMEDVMNPVEVYMQNVNDLQPKQITAINQNLNFPLGKTVLIHWRSADQLEIEGILTYPVNYQKGKRYPLLVEIHGGPSDVFLQKYIAHSSVYPLAYFANQGYAYLQPNIRGSTGYGAKFRNANYKDWGGKDYQDLLNGIQQVIAMGVADPKHIGILGWSYGGYLTAWAISHSKIFKAAIIGGGITDLISYTGTNDIPHFVPESLGYFWKNPRLYIERSPIFYVKNIETPTLLHYGMEDARVPPSQGYELYTALKLRGIPVELLLYPNTYHAIREPNLLLDAAKRNVEWMNRYLLAN